MSRVENHRGKFKIVPKLEGETLEQAKERVWKASRILEGKDVGEYDEDSFWDLYKKYFTAGDEIFELYENIEDEDNDSFATVHRNPDGSFSYHSSFYNGGTCLSEMLEEEIEKMKKNGVSFS